MKIIKFSLIFMVFLMYFASISFMLYGTIKYGDEKKIVKCYDRYSNEIIGQECYELMSEEYVGWGAFCGLGAIMFMFLWRLYDLSLIDI